MGAVSYLHSIATMAVYFAVLTNMTANQSSASVSLDLKALYKSVIIIIIIINHPARVKKTPHNGHTKQKWLSVRPTIPVELAMQHTNNKKKK